jgi:hypothetical protein
LRVEAHAQGAAPHPDECIFHPARQSRKSRKRGNVSEVMRQKDALWFLVFHGLSILGPGIPQRILALALALSGRAA